MSLRLIQTIQTADVPVYELGSISGQYKTLRMRAEALVEEFTELAAGDGTVEMTKQELTKITDLISALVARICVLEGWVK